MDERCDELATKNGLYDLHNELDAHEEKMAAAMEASNMDELKAIFPKFEQFNEDHLKKEEVNTNMKGLICCTIVCFFSCSCSLVFGYTHGVFLYIYYDY